ncbi:hypothetical protein [Corallococcus sp. AS-1-6]|uniref:hypothetical protein n=1 Tax=Corallococcus sp. AS-1-6 TaxID=2874599 RepID=UPI001CBEF4E1|nr:hypothetical protein [Corallococcus sp. AS-1-6]MBZ4371502.1 hypothetical protein [Corallococcus sp. AS-1-6]
MKPLHEVLAVLESHHRAGYSRPEADVPHLRFELERIERAQATEADVMRAAEDAIEQLAPDGSAATDRRWREEQTTYTAARTRLAALDLEEVLLRSTVECELWWARTRALVAA